ncbi:hypothetical protein PDQ34_26890 [Bacillus cereus]|nr:hypothetical protein [Bacillus cereus]MDA2572740.1 hypothetical protein [Bacillus cereus]
MPIGPAFRPKVLVVAANATQAKENWKNIKEYYSPDAYVHFASNRRCMLDGMNHLNRLGDCNLTIVLCGEYWKNIFYESELYWIWKKYGVPMIDVKDL